MINECFFICDNEEELLLLYNNFITKKNIYELFILINDFIQAKNEGKEIKKEKKEKNNEENEEYNDKKKKDEEKNKNKNKIYIIIDQYQEMYNMSCLFDLFKDIKIILLSSINDFDIKSNLILKYEDELKKEFYIKEDKNNKNSNNIIKYNYIDDLIDNKYYDNKIFQELIKNKIKMKQKDEQKVNEEFNFIYYILKKLGFIPKYFFGYLYQYDSIFDLIFNEYSNIMKKLDIFLLNKIIDINIIEELKEKKYLIKKEDINKVQTIQKTDFIKFINAIPLKYINFKVCNSGEFYFYYSFPLFAKILYDFIYFQKHKKIYFTSEDGSDRGIIFENLLKYQFRVYKKFNLDGYFKVETLINMKPTKKYSNINKEYISSKNNIFIDQKKREGESYDFAIYKPKLKKLLLFQAKYIINRGNVNKKKSLYDISAQKVLNSLNKLTNENLGEVYLLFISSIYYNYDIREKVVNTLSKQRINCIFYSLKKDSFYFNFKDNINEIELINSYMLIPSSKFYTNQEALENLDFEKEGGIYRKYNKKFKKKKKEKEEEISSGEESEEIEEKEKTNYKVIKKREKKEIFEPMFLLRRKTIRNVEDLSKVYKDILLYIQNNSRFHNKQIINLLGPIKTIENNESQINLNNEYAIILYLNEESMELDFNKKLGLVIYNNGVHYFVDLKENISYKSYNELIDSFQMNFFYAIGEKKKC